MGWYETNVLTSVGSQIQLIQTNAIADKSRFNSHIISHPCDKIDQKKHGPSSQIQIIIG